jgi:membrane fusion protein (multidrug efflux system)
MWVVSEGLKAGDQVIVEGFQKVKPGAPAKAVQWKQAAANTSQPPANPAAETAKPAGAAQADQKPKAK